MLATTIYSLLLATTLLAASPALSTDTRACEQMFNGKTVKIIVANNPGGGYDSYSRTFAPHYEKTTGARVLVENWPGGKGLIGTRKILDADPDGLTMGLMDTTKRLVANMRGDEDAPDVLEDFTLLGRIARSRHVFLAGTDTGIEDIDTLMALDRPAVFGVSNMRATGHLSAVLVADLLQIDPDIVAGLGSKNKRVLAASRGDVDITSANFFSAVSSIESGTVKPILQISSTPIAAHPDLEGVPLLGGLEGVAAQRAQALNQDVDAAIATAAAIETTLSAGRIFVAPAGMDDATRICTQQAVYSTLQSEDLGRDLKKAGLMLDSADGPSAGAELERSMQAVDSLIPVIQRSQG